MRPLRDEQDPNPAWRRRELLVAGAGVALLPSFSWWPPTTACEGLAVGYCPMAPDAEGAPRVVAASRLPSGDPRLALGGARVEVHGVVGGAELLHRQGIRSADLWVRFDVAEVEYLAWSCRSGPVATASPPVRFNLPCEHGLALALALDGERFETRLVRGRVPGLPKLRPGHYRIAPDTPSSPAWHEGLVALSVEPVDGRALTS